MYGVILVKPIVLEVEAFGTWLATSVMCTVLIIGLFIGIIDILWVISENYIKKKRRKKKNKSYLTYIRIN